MGDFRIVCHKGKGFLMALCSTQERAERYLEHTLPDYISRGYLMDKTLVASDFSIQVEYKQPSKPSNHSS